jgi:hypothetical protein
MSNISMSRCCQFHFLEQVSRHPLIHSAASESVMFNGFGMGKGLKIG